MMTEQDIKHIQDNLATFVSSVVCIPDGPAVAPSTYSDEHIEYWAVQYRSRRIWRYGVTFEMFLRYPQEILDALLRRGFLPLLPEQQKVQQRLDEQDLAAGCTDPRTSQLLAGSQDGCERPGEHQLQAPAWHGDRLVQSMRPRLRLPRWKTGGHV